MTPIPFVAGLVPDRVAHLNAIRFRARQETRLALAAEARLRYQERRVLAIYDRACHGGRSLLPDVPWRMAEAAVQADLLRGMALGLGAFAKGMGR